MLQRRGFPRWFRSAAATLPGTQRPYPDGLFVEIRHVVSAASASRTSDAAAPAAAVKASQPTTDVTAITNRDEFLLELGQALGGQAAVRPVETLEAALAAMAGSKRSQVLVIDARTLPNVRAAVDAACARAAARRRGGVRSDGGREAAGHDAQGQQGVCGAADTDRRAQDRGGARRSHRGGGDQQGSRRSHPGDAGDAAAAHHRRVAAAGRTARRACRRRQHAAHTAGGRRRGTAGRCRRGRLVVLPGPTAGCGRRPPCGGTRRRRHRGGAARRHLDRPGQGRRAAGEGAPRDARAPLHRAQRRQRAALLPLGRRRRCRQRRGARWPAARGRGAGRTLRRGPERRPASTRPRRRSRTSRSAAPAMRAWPPSSSACTARRSPRRSPTATSTAPPPSCTRRSSRASIPAEQLAQWRADIAHRQDDAKVQHLAGLVDDRIRDGKLDDPRRQRQELPARSCRRQRRQRRPRSAPPHDLVRRLPAQGARGGAGEEQRRAAALARRGARAPV